MGGLGGGALWDSLEIILKLPQCGTLIFFLVRYIYMTFYSFFFFNLIYYSVNLLSWIFTFSRFNVKWVVFLFVWAVWKLIFWWFNGKLCMYADLRGTWRCHVAWDWQIFWKLTKCAKLRNRSQGSRFKQPFCNIKGQNNK